MVNIDNLCANRFMIRQGERARPWQCPSSLCSPRREKKRRREGKRSEKRKGEERRAEETFAGKKMKTVSWHS